MDKRDRSLLLIFCRNEIRGRVKSRLAATVGEDRALEIYRMLCNHTAAVIRQLTCDRIVCYDDHLVSGDCWSDAVDGRRIQVGRDLGERMAESVAWGFSQGYGSVVIIGTDCPQLAAEHVDLTFTMLQTHDAVIGPAADGGYYLIGLSSWCRDLFHDKLWGSDRVFRETFQDLERLGKSCFLLPVLYDVDVEADLVHMNGLLASGS